jgi:predicted  nucleic acid-binding Zn-ribbon protein
MKWWHAIIILVAFGAGYLLCNFLSKGDTQGIAEQYELRDSIIEMALKDTLRSLNREVRQSQDSIHILNSLIDVLDIAMEDQTDEITSLNNQLKNAYENLHLAGQYDLSSTTAEDIIWLNKRLRN